MGPTLRLQRLRLYCLLLAAAAFVLQPLAHAEHRLLMALPGLAAEPATAPAHHQHVHHEHHLHDHDHVGQGHAQHADAGHGQHDDAPLPICCDCVFCKLAQSAALPTAQAPPGPATAGPSPAPNTVAPAPSGVGQHLHPPGRAPPLS